METFKSRWGFHPVDFATFSKLKTLHKRYWETVYAVAKWARHDRKTVHKKGEAPSYCPVFVKEQGYWETFTNRDGFKGTRYRAKTLLDHRVLESYRQAAKPCTTTEEVQPLPLTDEQIDTLYHQVEQWFSANTSTTT